MSESAHRVETRHAGASDDDDVINSYFSSSHLAHDLKGRTIRSGVMTMGAQGLRLVVTLASLSLLGRLLQPSDYGLVGMVTAVSNFVIMFQDMGLAMATIQSPKVTHRQVSNLFWLNVAFGMLMTLLLVAASPLVAMFYGEPSLKMITCSLATGMVITAVAVQHQALLRRQMRFSAVAAIDLAALSVGTACGVLLARGGAGYWALVAMTLTTSATWSISTWIACRWVPSLPSRGSGIRPLLSFGTRLSGYEIVNYATRNLDNVLVGRVWGADALGFYGRAYNLFLLPITSILSPFTTVMIPSLSRLQDQPDRFRNYYLQSLSVVYLVTMPVAVMLICFADEAAVLVLGPRWQGAGSILQILSVAALFQPIHYCLVWLFISLGRARQFLRWGLSIAALTCTCFFIGVKFGPRGVAIAYTGSTILAFVPCILYAIRGTPIAAGDVLRAVGPHMLAAVASVTAGLLPGVWLGEAIHPLLKLVLVAATFVLVELAMLRLWLPTLTLALQAFRKKGIA